MIKQPVGFWRRLAANLLDSIIIGIPLSILSYFVAGDWEGDIFTSLLNAVYALIIPVVWSGYTVGKKIMGIRIAKVNGEKLGFGTMLMRTLVSGIVYALTLGVGIIISAFMVGLREDKRAIHDFIAGTYVTREAPEMKSLN